MKPVDSSMFVRSTSTVTDAQRLLAASGHERAAVLDSNGFIIGYVGRTELGDSVAQR
jgi:hypothetical protein